MEKAPDAFRTISEVSEWLDTPTYVLRFWESRFSQIKPVKRAGGRRYYRPEDMLLLGGIKKLLHFDGHTIKGVQNLIKEKGAKYVASFSPGLDEKVISPTSKDEEPTLDIASLTKEAKPKEKEKEKENKTAAPLQLQPSDAETAAPVEDKKKQGARAVKITVHKKTKQTAADENPVAVEKENAKPALAAKKKPKAPIGDISKGILFSGPFLVGSQGSYSEDDFGAIETLYYSLKMVRNNMKRAHRARR